MKVITIGRSPDNDHVVNDPFASGHHLQIIQHDDGHFTLSDFGSTNGTYINGHKTTNEVEISDTDIVRIGNTTIPWRAFFEDTEKKQKKHSSVKHTNPPDADETETAKKEDKSTWQTMSVWQKVLIVFLTANIIAAVFVPSLIICIPGAALLCASIWLKASLDKHPAVIEEPNEDSPKALITVLGIGTTFFGSIKFRRVNDTFVSYTFFQLLLLFFPTGCYRAEKAGYKIWRFYGSERKKKSEIVCIYLTIYGLVLWIPCAVFTLTIAILPLIKGIWS